MILTEDQKAALRKVVKWEGRRWKSKLRIMWEKTYYPGYDDVSSTLHYLRNSGNFGPRGLVAIRPKDLV